MSLISVSHLRKDYTHTRSKRLFFREKIVRTALNDITFSIEEGEFLGYIGHNGAGKSTTIKILSGILVPTHGEVIVLGQTPSKDRKKIVREIGVVFGQKTGLWWDLPVIESFQLLQKIYEVCPKLDFATFLGWMPRDICSRGRYLNREGVKNPCLV